MPQQSPLLEDDVWTCGEGFAGHCSMESGSWMRLGETGVGGSELPRLLSQVACCADSAKARANIRAALFTAGWEVMRDTDLTSPGVQSKVTAPKN